MKQILIVITAAVFILGLTACTGAADQSPIEPKQSEQTTQDTTKITEKEESKEPEPQIEIAEENTETEENREMKMMIGDTYVTVEWENNESVAALRELTADSPLTVQMSMYGGFEQVGSIGQSLPRSDVQTTTSAGDIVLYSGNQLVVFYGSNSWAYTRLGHITDKTAQELTELLGNGDVTVTIDGGR